MKGKVLIMANKVTKKEMFATMRELFSETMSDTFDVFGRDDETVTGEEMVQFLDHEIELLNRKRSGKSSQTKTQKENEVTKATILEVLRINKADKESLTEEERNEETFHAGLRIAEIQESNEELKGLSNQKISSLLTQLVKAGLVERTADKKVAYFNFVE